MVQCIGEVAFREQSLSFPGDFNTLTIFAVEVVDLFPNVWMVISGLNGHSRPLLTRVSQDAVVPLDQGYHHFVG